MARTALHADEAGLAMRLILSRKGFDSASGGCASPIFPDGSMIALPIPDKRSPVRYTDLTWRGRNLGRVVERLTGGRQRRDYRAHLDPDLRRADLRRDRGWRPSLGQVGAAQGHLRKQGVGAGDLFLFFGLFRRVNADLRWAGPPEHRIWGWMQVGEVARVDADVRGGGKQWAWAERHPHLAFDPNPMNTLYVAAGRLALPGTRATTEAGHGVVELAVNSHRLTAPDAARASKWALPTAFLPRGRRPLTFHADTGRWSERDGVALLDVVSRGQEFVLDLDEYPDVVPWVAELLDATA